MGMFEKIFGRREQPVALKNAKLFRMLEGYTPAWTTFAGSIYEADLIRASLDAWGRNAAKLKPVIKGAALPELTRRLKVKPNRFNEWSQFLYQTATVLGVRNNAFLVKTRADDGTQTGVINIVPDSWELIEFDNEPWIRFILPNNKRRAERLAEVGILTRFQYKSELFGENNEAMRPVLDLISIQRQGITEGIKNGNSYRFWAKNDNFASDEDLGSEMQRFNKFTFGKKETAGGVLLFPNTYEEIHEMKPGGYTVDKEQQAHIRTNVFDYYGTNEEIIQNKADSEKWLAFYEGFTEWFAIQLSEVMSGMTYTDNERMGFGNQIFFSSNRLQYMSNADKLSFVSGLGDRGMITKNEAREVFNLPPLPEPYGSQVLARGEYYDTMNPPDKKVGGAEDQ
ncbi:MAG: phage portal protein, partial [Lachnospiraceae bacterium]|nr:phage portal protein [Lachnospiraceae bacterium]